MRSVAKSALPPTVASTLLENRAAKSAGFALYLAEEGKSAKHAQALAALDDAAARAIKLLDRALARANVILHGACRPVPIRLQKKREADRQTAEFERLRRLLVSPDTKSLARLRELFPLARAKRPSSSKCQPAGSRPGGRR